jgi:hypothetical protein
MAAVAALVNIGDAMARWWHQRLNLRPALDDAGR